MDGSVIRDFLYHDPQRIGSFLSQFNADGVLQSLKQTSGSGQTETRSSSGGLGAKAIVNAELRSSLQTGDSSQAGAERTYDPLWTNARLFLDHIVEHGLIETSLSSARLGRFVLAKGNLQIVDIGLARGAYELDTFKSLVRGGNGATSQVKLKHQNRRSQHSEVSSTIDFAFEMLGILPHTIQAVVSSGGRSVWSTLKSDCMAISSSDLVLKHSLDIPGQWSMVGILDALPEDNLPEAPSDIVPVMAEHGFGVGLLSLLAPITRQFLGRQASHYGMTPLLIFRDVEVADRS
ncbi:hypothetical protein [Brevundimonas sp. M20]|uniref:hypothetical protein n=1 Tax=Brevundimonas sp. M20 TaxID=2591463 RepID=UPI001146F584|nr:hypothetical protein [Brevundimonas sp. M20]QDH74666.1 hypothetical protein FKQ52_15370 [Brevundimonas sp. M20]